MAQNDGVFLCGMCDKSMIFFRVHDIFKPSKGASRPRKFRRSFLDNLGTFGNFAPCVFFFMDVGLRILICVVQFKK